MESLEPESSDLESSVTLFLELEISESEWSGFLGLGFSELELSEELSEPELSFSEPELSESFSESEISRSELSEPEFSVGIFRMGMVFRGCWRDGIIVGIIRVQSGISRARSF